MQRQLLTQYASAPLRVYAIWVPLPSSVSRDMWDAMNITDPRALQYWDGEHVISQWFAKQVDGYDGVSWDYYYLYGQDAQWETIPAPLVGTGGTVYSKRQLLIMQVGTLLGK